ncbi:MAG: hypothetical protein C0404_06330 [Verrucomicrobia bacterium]|nr:hypothetical protein [Verrucomicrobiota bacterium]
MQKTNGRLPIEQPCSDLDKRKRYLFRDIRAVAGRVDSMRVDLAVLMAGRSPGQSADPKYIESICTLAVKICRAARKLHVAFIDAEAAMSACLGEIGTAYRSNTDREAFCLRLMDELDSLFLQLDQLLHPAPGPTPPGKGGRRTARVGKQEFKQSLNGKTNSCVRSLKLETDGDKASMTVCMEKVIPLTDTPLLLLDILQSFATEFRNHTREGWVEREIVVTIMRNVLEKRTTDKSLHEEVRKLRIKLIREGVDPGIIQVRDGLMRLDLIHGDNLTRRTMNPFVRRMVEIVVNSIKNSPSK